jgi:hypothetical protein
MHAIQSREKSSLQITPVLPNSLKIIVLNEIDQLFHYLVHLKMKAMFL